MNKEKPSGGEGTVDAEVPCLDSSTITRKQSYAKYK